MGGAVGGQGLHRLNPANRLVQLFQQIALEGFQVRGHGGTDVLHQRNLRRLPVDRSDRLGETLGSRAHQFAVGRHADRQRQRTLGATSLAAFDGALYRRLGAGDHHLARGVEVHGADHFALGRFGAGGNHVSIFQAENGSHAALPGRNRFLHQLATTLHQLDRFTEGQAAGSLTLGEAVKLVERRGQLMQEAVPAGQGGMAAILGLEDADVIAACAEAAQGEVVSAVNFNSPGQVVIAGAKAAVERAIEGCKARGAKRALPLPVSVPSHCELMRPAAERFAESIAAINWQAPQIPLVQNVSAAVASDLETLKRDLLEQLYKPVRWVESVQTLAANGATQLVECGPGKVLAGLNKRCAEGVSTSNLNTPDAFAAARAALA